MATKKDLARLIYPEFRFGKTSIEQGLELVRAGVGGFCFYGGTAEEVRHAAKALKDAADHPLLIAADYEEGVGRRVQGMTELPSNMAVGAVAGIDEAENFAYNKGLVTAQETVSLGADWVFAPVLDLAVNADNPIVSLRSFGSDPERVSRLAEAYCKGLTDGGALNSLKHFPGHGRTNTDSHLALPELDADEELIRETDMYPFINVLPYADSIMAGHLLAKPLDADYPASLSKKVITGIIRREMGFDKTVITDALNMHALNRWGEPGIMALAAGADILLYPADPFTLINALEKGLKDGVITEERISGALQRQQQLIEHSGKIKQAAKNTRRSNCLIPAGEFNARIAAQSVAVTSGLDHLSRGSCAAYLEPGRTWENREGRAFTSALENCGIRLVPYEKVKSGELREIDSGSIEYLVAAAFTGPQAFSGKINLSTEQKAELAEAFPEFKRVYMVSFGSPFALQGIEPAPQVSVCAYGKLPQFQQQAAAIITGKARPGGIDPTFLK